MQAKSLRSLTDIPVGLIPPPVYRPAYTWLVIWLGSALILAATTSRSADSAAHAIGVVTVDARRAAATFRPDDALGAGVDGMERGDVGRVYTPANVAAMRAAGLKPLAYRLRTELGVEAWHWNQRGTFSDAAKKQGYWTSDSSAGPEIQLSNGYTLPRRGATGDQANDRSYSRIDDGDANSFWKSNPYLDARYTGEDNRLHPQWILADFGRRLPLNAARILWGRPFARLYRVEYWSGEDPADPQELPDNSGWKPFARGSAIRGVGGADFHVLSARAVETRWVRILLIESSDKAPPGCTDPRDALGYAVREIGLGIARPGGTLRDRIRHARNAAQQTRIYVSSTDSWHRASDLDANVEQPGFDRILRSGLTNGLPVLMPVSVLYGTPDDSAAEIAWLEKRGCPLKRIEVGEEPDGQYMLPEDYGALFIQWAGAIHAVDPRLQLGGPGFQTVLYGWQCWPDAHGNSSWMNRFLGYLSRRGHLGDFRFFSFEWYPFDQIGAATGPQLAIAPTLLRNVVSQLRKEGVPATIPWIITEYGYSSYAGAPEVDLPGALLNAEIVAQFLTLGGHGAYLYGYEPNTLIREASTDTWGNLTLFLSDRNRVIRCRLPTFYGAQMLALDWAEPGAGLHRVFTAASSVKNAGAERLVTAYAVQRPDSRWALLLLNKDPRHAHRIRVVVRQDRAGPGPFVKAEMWQYGPDQYTWHAEGPRGHPGRDLPPSHRTTVSGASPISLPPYSITVLRSR